jgi:signal transduction histidine kinase
VILKPFFRRHFWTTLIVFALVLSAGSFLAHQLTHIERADFFRSQGELILELVDKQPDKIGFVRQLNLNNRDLLVPIEVDVVKDGVSVVTGEHKILPESSSVEQRLFIHDIEIPEPAKFVVNFTTLRGITRHGPTINFAVMAVAIFLASTLSIFLQFWSFRKMAGLAKTVLTRMQNGDLKARFPTSKLDEVGKIMVLFNQMAEEIERLVERLKQNERARVELLQELTHDLRTPVSSLRNLIETLRFDEERLKPKDKGELMELAFQETEYLTRLVEDLLFLALVIEPKYKAECMAVDLPNLIQAQLSVTARNYPSIQHEFVYRQDASKFKVTGAPHMLQRLLRNALENAFSFASERVRVVMRQTQDDEITVSIRDDGPGLNPEALENFGKKRSTRLQGSKKYGRISVGLGSVVMNAIVQAHGGSVVIVNLVASDGTISGAELTIQIRANPKPSEA